MSNTNGAAARYDAIVVGAGPAGSVCAAHLARAGRRVMLIERAHFPRDKVCGDCLNPSVLPILERLQLRQRLEALPHTAVHTIRYQGIAVAPLSFPVPARSEFVIKRRGFDALLVQRALELGVDFQDNAPVTSLASGWAVTAGEKTFRAPILIAADGRNSTVARLTRRLPKVRRERAALQCHCPRPKWHDDSVRMMFYRGGYGGTAPISTDEINLCLVARPANLSRVRQQAERDFDLSRDTEWRTIAPLLRPDARDIARNGLFLLGDAARIVEPFTGEGIYYAMRSGELAAEAILHHKTPETAYRQAHRKMYRGRLWINRLARMACHHPRLTSAALRLGQIWPKPFAILTAKVVDQT